LGKLQTVVDLSALIPEPEWVVHREALTALRERGVRFAVGGGLAFSALSGRWRNTKDVDLFLPPEDHEVAIEALFSVGFTDYFEQIPYDRKWIFRGYKDRLILDLIWQMANYRAPVEPLWVSRGQPIELWGDRIQALAAEELIWTKLYILQRERCDWPDLLNLLYACGEGLDWPYLLSRLGEDVRLLAGVLSVYAWLEPEHAARLPGWLWPELGLPAPSGPSHTGGRRRIDLVDSRDWFGPSREGL
jgi:hypothetical protein